MNRKKEIDFKSKNTSKLKNKLENYFNINNNYFSKNKKCYNPKFIINNKIKNEFQNNYIENIIPKDEKLICENTNEIIRLISKKINYFKINLYNKKSPLNIKFIFSPEIYDYYIYTSHSNNYNNVNIYKNTNYIYLNNNKNYFQEKNLFIKIWIFDNCFCEIITKFGLDKKWNYFSKKKKKSSINSQEILNFKKYINNKENFKKVLRKRNNASLNLKKYTKSNIFSSNNNSQIVINKKKLIIKNLQEKRNFLMDKRYYENELYNLQNKVNIKNDICNYILNNWSIIIKFCTVINEIKKINIKKIGAEERINKKLCNFKFTFLLFNKYISSLGDSQENRLINNSLMTFKIILKTKSKVNSLIIINILQKIYKSCILKNKIIFKGKIYFHIHKVILKFFDNHNNIKEEIISKYNKIYYLITKRYNMPFEIRSSSYIILRYFFIKYYNLKRGEKFEIKEKYIYNFFNNYFNLKWK